MSSIPFDVRASFRRLRDRPLLTVVVTATLGIGLGFASALFGVIEALYVRPLPLDRAKEVVVVRATNPDQGLVDEPLSHPEMTDLLASSPHVVAFGGLRDWSFPLLIDGTRTPLPAILATAGVFDVFRVRPHLGTLFTDTDTRVVLVTFRSWKRRFGGDPSIVGRTLTLGNDAYTIIGVLPEALTAPSFRDAELWAPLSNDPDQERGRKLRNLLAYARLTDRARFTALGPELATRAAALGPQYPETNKGWSARATPLLEYELGGVLRQLILLSLAAALLLAMACANVANLIFTDSMSRRSELGLRTALGASSARLFAGLFFDHLLLSLAGGAAAGLLATVLLSLTSRLAAAGMPRFDEVRPDAGVVAFVLLGVVIAAALFAGLSVAWSARAEPAEHIRATSRSLTDAAPRWVSGSLVATQVAFAFVLLVVALLFGRGYYTLATTNPGFDTRGLLLLRVQATERLPRLELVMRAREAVALLAARPGATSATIASSGALFGSREEMDVSTDAMPQPLRARFANVDHGFFGCMRMPLLAGRDFTPADDARDGMGIVIVSRAFSRRLFPHGDAIGKVIHVGPRHARREIVGIAADVTDTRRDRGGALELYLPFAQDPRAFFFLIVRGASTALPATIPGFMIVSTKTMAEAIGENLFTPRLQLALLLLFGVAATALATVAIYGMVTLIAATRRGELALRMALGATPRQAQALLLQSIAAPVLLAMAAGAALLVAFTPRLRLLLTNAGPDPFAVLLAIAFILALTIAASWRSARAVAGAEPGALIAGR